VHCQSPDDWRTSPDMATLAAWFENGVAEDFVGAPIPGLAEVHEYQNFRQQFRPGSRAQAMRVPMQPTTSERTFNT
jgi:hypothetical protein